MPRKETILAICAHNDDAVIGVGGTLAKYRQEGKRVVTIIFSYGTSSHPHLKEHIAREMRDSERVTADRIIGIDKCVHFNLKEGRFREEIISKRIAKEVLKVIDEEKPINIFTHSADDPHPDHKALHMMVRSMVDKGNIRSDVYSFNVWNIFTIRGRQRPRLVVDISGTFKAKIRAFRAHKSQKIAIIMLLWNLYAQAIINGWCNRTRYAEIFYKIN